MANIEVPRLQKQYIDKCKPELIKEFGYENWENLFADEVLMRRLEAAP